MWCLYIARTQSGAFYTGVTDNLQRRIKEHKQGKGGHYTSYNRVKEILYTEKLSDKEQAKKREQQIKRWRRAKKLALINGDFDNLKKLSISGD